MNTRTLFTQSSNLYRSIRLTIAGACALLLAACSSVGVGISVPIGPFGSVSIGTSSAGGISVGAGVGVGGASVGIGGTIPTTAPTSPHKPDAQPDENLPAPAAAASTSKAQ